MKYVLFYLCTAPNIGFILLNSSFIKANQEICKLAKKNKKQVVVQDSENVKAGNIISHQVKKSSHRPEVTNMDEIALLLDDELSTKISILEEGRAKTLNSGSDPYYWEVELAYFRREFSLRKVRRDLHEKWVNEQIRVFDTDESDLPYADFDNLKYVMVNLYEKKSRSKCSSV